MRSLLMREACGAASVGTLMVMAMTGRAGKGGGSSVGTPPPALGHREGKREPSGCSWLPKVGRLWNARENRQS